MLNAINKDNTPRIEIKTLAGMVSESSDEKLATLMTEGWELLCDPVLTTINSAYEGVQHYEIIKLMRVTQPDEDPEEDEETEEVTTAREIDVRPPLPIESSAVVTGTVLGIDAPTVDVDRKPVEEVGFAEAVHSGRYSADELRAIGDREALAAGLKVMRERQTWNGRTWEGFINRLPLATPIKQIAN